MSFVALVIVLMFPPRGFLPFAMIFSFLSVNIDYMHDIHVWTK